MTVYISADAKNLREELASLRNQGGYEEQQFYFDSLVTNGTFDTDVSGWTADTDTSATYDSGRLKVTKTASSGPYGIVNQTITTVAGKQYLFQADSITGSGPSAFFRFNNGALGSYTETEGTTHSAYFTATSTSTEISVGVASSSGNQYIFWDNIAIYETDGTDVVHRMPKGWVPLHVYEDGLLQREGAANDYEVVYDGFDYYVKPAVAPSATTQTCVIGVRK